MPYLGWWTANLGCLLILLALFRYFWLSRQRLLQAQSWLTVKGRITVCELTKVGHNFWPRIEYSYQVYGKDLQGTYLFLDTIHNNPNSKYSRLVAYKAALAFKEDTTIDVYYNPNHPEQSALDVAIPRKLTIILILLGIFLILHISCIAWPYLRYLVFLYTAN